MKGRIFTALIAFALALPAAAQDLQSQAADAYRRGDLRQAAKLYSDAADAEQDLSRRAEIRVQAAWTFFAMKNRTKAEEALAQALRDNPTYEIVPDFYTTDFVALFEKTKARLQAAPTPAPTIPPSQTRPQQPGGSLPQIRQRLAQAVDAAGIEAVLSEIQPLEINATAATLPDILTLKAEALERLGRTSEALELRGRIGALRAAAQAGQGTSPVPYDTLLEARRLLKSERPEDAVALLRGVLVALPSCFPALEVLGEALAEAGKLDEAHDALITAKLGNEKPETLLLLGDVELRRGRLTDARDAFRRVTELDNLNDRAWAALGFLSARNNDFASAKQHLDRALQLNSTLFEARVLRAQIALLDGQPELAQQYLAQAVQLRPEDQWAAGWLGLTLLAQRNLPAATEKLQAAGKGGPVQFTLGLAESLRRQGKPLEALQALEQQSGDEPTVGLLRARCLLDAGKPAEAEALLRQLVVVRPQDPSFSYLLGYSLYAQRKWDEAARELARTSALPGYPADSGRRIVEIAEATRAAEQLRISAATPKPVQPR